MEKSAFNLNSALMTVPIAMAMMIAVLPTASAAVQSITVIECGQAKTTDKSIFSPGIDEGVASDIAINCYLIAHDKGLMIWDTGLADGLINKPEGIVLAGGKLKIFVKKTLASQMKELGIKADEVKHMAFSHMHPDITGNSSAFSAATWYVQKPEYKAAFSKDPKKYRFNPKTYSGLKDNKTVILQGRRDVFGDGSVVIMPAPGHTPGSQVLYVELPSGPVILAGDLWAFDSNRTNKTIPDNDFDIEATRKSRIEIEALAKKTGAKIWVMHDPAQNAALPHAPQKVR